MESRQRRVWHQAAGTLFYTRVAQCHARLRRGSIQRAGRVDSIPQQVADDIQGYALICLQKYINIHYIFCLLDLAKLYIGKHKSKIDITPTNMQPTF